MKKIYSKPEIVFEDFTLSESIAGNCDIIIDTQARSSCAYISSGGIATFVSGVTACVFKEEDGYNELCYHVPFDNNDLFNS